MNGPVNFAWNQGGCRKEKPFEGGGEDRIEKVRTRPPIGYSC